ncbi:MAG: 23S rRNA (adenine(2030)-N(6))-methyltransferase RlmJ, partial [Woeseiaceae bacterium]
RKEAPVCVIDTHAGAGVYELASGYAQQTGEYRDGIGRLWERHDAPAALRPYLELVRRCNGAGPLRRYPGSPWIARALQRPQDRLLLCELHPSDYAALAELFAGDRGVQCFREDGFRFCRGLLPPRERRGLILMDPSYELGDEYRKVFAAVQEHWRRFPGGTHALWYPLIEQSRIDELRRDFETSAIRDALNLELLVHTRRGARRMYGCGMVIVNPPWTLAEEMQAVLPWLAACLAADGRGGHAVEQWVAE